MSPDALPKNLLVAGGRLNIRRNRVRRISDRALRCYPVHALPAQQRRERSSRVPAFPVHLGASDHHQTPAPSGF